ncbi:chemotaxis protein CheB [Deinococcus aestuarii]|uniref:chemotaxis protein CheB n=1 Tax=Deinococcus aestuarii TaxID=2774531 RepID=UPI001C0CC242|nr:chemotaxis protein CheB [Deinococcus aestuarii]
MSPPSLVVIGGSAGALSALLKLVPSLPTDFPAPILLVVHTPADQPSYLPQVLSHAGPLPARHARQGDPLEPGSISIAPPDHHLLVVDDHLHLSRGPKENLARPAIDVLFRSAAESHGPGVIGVILSGMLNDGASGLWTIEQCGGRTLVQHPEDAEFPEMPLSALRRVAADGIVRAREIGPHLVDLLREMAVEGGGSSMDEEGRRRLTAEVAVGAGRGTFENGALSQGPPSTLTCPECHGVLGQIEEGGVTRYRCHTGHAFTAKVLLLEMRRETEATLWRAKRLLDEQVMLLDHLGQRAGSQEEGATRHEEARVARERGEVLRQFTQRAELEEPSRQSGE